MITRQEKIDAIYEKIANKDLSFWCCFQGEKSSYVIQNPYWCFVWWDWQVYTDCCDSELNNQIKIEKIIGHPVMIGDVMDFFEKHSETDNGTITQWDGVKTIKMWFTKEKKIEIINHGLLRVWTKKREPLEEQSYECINIIYSLISEQWEN